jgi:hypothetical protein
VRATELPGCALIVSLPCRPETPPLHTPDEGWTLQQHLKQQRKAGGSWRQLYWQVWAAVHVLYCQACHQHFPVRELYHCSYHPHAAAFTSSSDSGRHPCCGRPAWRPGLPLSNCQGCTARAHQPAAASGGQQQQRKQAVAGAAAAAAGSGGGLDGSGGAAGSGGSSQRELDAVGLHELLQLVAAFPHLSTIPYVQPAELPVAEEVRGASSKWSTPAVRMLPLLARLTRQGIMMGAAEASGNGRTGADAAPSTGGWACMQSRGTRLCKHVNLHKPLYTRC